MAQFGECPKCPNGARQVLLIGGVCKHHFNHPDEIVQRDEYKGKGSAKKGEKKELDKWFEDQIKQIPKCCENCNKPIVLILGMTKRAYIAHIVPKSKVKSVATHEQNRLFLCLQCHTDYDGRQDKASKMPVIELARQRYNEFAHLIPQKEIKYVPEFLKKPE